MSQPPSSWDPPGQQGYPQSDPQEPRGAQNPYGSTEAFPQPGQQQYTPPPSYGGYPPAAYGTPYGQPGYPPQYGPQYGGPYGAPSGPQRPGAALAAAVLSYIQAGVVLISTIFVLAAGTELTELLLIGIVQLISVGLLIFGAVQVTAGSGRMVLFIGNGLQLALVLYWLIRITSLGTDLEQADSEGAIVIPLFYAVMPAVALGLGLNGAVTRFIAEKQAQARGAGSGHSPQWGR